MKRAAIFSMTFIMMMILAACEGQPDPVSVRDKNLATLSRVWGFTKYTHPVFLTGEMCWDEELFNLIPVVYSAEAGDVGGILYDWFVSLGDDGFEDIDKNDINDYSQMADFSWINQTYLGLPLFERLSSFQTIQPIDRTKAPVYFDIAGNSSFTNQQTHEDMDYSDIQYRLLGLFRMWNAIEYYFPYRDILDRDWHELLLEYIPKMIEGICRSSYESTLASLSRHMHDAHVIFVNTTDFLYSNLWSIFSEMNSIHDAVFFLEPDLFNDIIGYSPLPARLLEAEGHLIVSEPMFNDDLLSGDVILAVNSRDIDDITAGMLQFMSYPNDEKSLAYLTRRGLWSQSSDMTVTVRRGDDELDLQVEFNGWETSYLISGHVHFENNIGLINPAHLSQNEIHRIMQDFADTDGLIVDLRQSPTELITYSLAEYLVEESQAFAVLSSPSRSVPGMFLNNCSRSYSGGLGSFGAFLYENPVVLLMDEWTVSNGEYTIVSLRNGANVTVMGNNSIGANGNTTFLPLPGGISIVYTGLGVFTPEGEQTQRIGLAPDIRVDRTIQGIAEGRDEQMEAAIEFILESTSNR